METHPVRSGPPDASALGVASDSEVFRCGSAERDACYRATADASGDGYTALRALREGAVIVDWIVVDANDLVRQRWSWVVGDIAGVRVSQLNGAADNSRFFDVYRAALEAGERQEMDLELALPGGKGGWRRVVVVPVDRDTITVVTRDITRERYFEAALERERDRYRTLAQGSPGGNAEDRGTEARFVSRSAAALFLGAGIITTANSFLAHPQRVDVRGLRITGALSMLSALFVRFLPWARHRRVVASGLIGGAIGFLVLSDQFNHYSRTDSAVAVYPMFFIIVVAWSGLTQRRGAATITACVSALALGALLAEGGHASVGWQCVLVTMPAAAVLGEVLSWSYNRAVQLARLEAHRRLHDPLTGLANRAMLTDRLDQALARVRRTDRPLAVLFLDLDQFKQVNDTLGHPAGDKLLIEAAERLRAAVRENDTVARLGGDEFVVLCEDVDHPTDVAQVAQRMLDAVDLPFACGTSEAKVTVSIGIAFSTNGKDTADTMLQHADTALYRAKDSGRARYEIFDETMQHWVASRRELEVALGHAIARDELRVFFQPIITADTGTIVSFEALARWDRPGFGLVAPAEFIPVAEETGLILEIGRSILEQACRAAKSWAIRWPDRRISVAVNISSRQILAGTIVEVVSRALEVSGLDPTLLTLELTESTLIDDSFNAQPLLRAVRDLGVNLALDDFGTGYSSLTYLREFPVNVIKIDQSFIRAIGTEREDTAIVAAVIALARNLNLRVVAEGIETPEQLSTLVHLNCELLQGYLFSHPKPIHELADLINRPTHNLANHNHPADSCATDDDNAGRTLDNS